MKKYFNLVFYGVLALLLLFKIPTWWTQWSMQARPAPVGLVQRLSGETVQFPLPGQKQIVVFWATWCGPCQVELKRLNDLMSQGKIKNHQLLAISIQEQHATVSQFMTDNNFQFITAIDATGDVATKYNVKGTPTVVLIDEKSEITWISSGLSPSLEWRIKRLLN
jgi:cytochrome c biogenesis protein CcmG, thiol:disulfide interchange protein DsbE